MCKVDSAWFQAAILSLGNSTDQGRDNIMSFTKVSTYGPFLRDILGTILSPNSRTSDSMSTPAVTKTSNNTTSTGAPFQPRFSLLFVLLACFQVLP